MTSAEPPRPTLPQIYAHQRTSHRPPAHQRTSHQPPATSLRAHQPPASALTSHQPPRSPATSPALTSPALTSHQPTSTPVCRPLLIANQSQQATPLPIPLTRADFQWAWRPGTLRQCPSDFTWPATWPCLNCLNSICATSTTPIGLPLSARIHFLLQ